MTVWSRLYKFLGSLKLAVVLLATLIGVLTWATFYESETSTKAVTNLVYRSWWFNALLLLLACNIGAAALLRWPWKRRHVGFVITHAGLIVLLGGCSASWHYGTEGMMELRVGHPPSSTVRVDQEAITVIVPETGQRVTTPVRLHKNGRVSPRVIEVGNNLRLPLEECYPNSALEPRIEEGGAERRPAVFFRLHSAAVEQDIRDWLVADAAGHDRLSLGPANIRFVAAGNIERFTNTTFEASGPELHVDLAGQHYRFDLPAVDETISFGPFQARLMGYWPDFAMDEQHRPMSVSEEPNNPAALLIVTGEGREQRHFIFAHPEMAPIVRTIRGEPIPLDIHLSAGETRAPSGLTVVLAPDDQLYYRAVTATGVVTGPLETGKPISPGWMDFEFTIERVVTNAVISADIVPLPYVPEHGMPAVRVMGHWVRFGAPEVLEIDGHTVHVIFGFDAMRLPFTVRLEDFVVERDEGSHNVAGWTSKVIFEDAERGLTQRASVWMNNPAWFRGYKFSQASWNPNDLKYTVLQVKKDPLFVTWLTWSGATLIVTGIVIMFYFRNWLIRSGERKAQREERREEMVTA